MLVHVDFSGKVDPIIAMIAQINGQSTEVVKIQRGYYKSPLNFSNIVSDAVGGLSFEKEYPDLGELGSYGVCDTPQQFITKYNDQLESDDRKFVVGFAHISKDPSNAGKGGGWRWHKWGEYVGEGDPQCEYLDDEEGFENGVYVYTIINI